MVGAQKPFIIETTKKTTTLSSLFQFSPSVYNAIVYIRSLIIKTSREKKKMSALNKKYNYMETKKKVQRVALVCCVMST